MVAEKRTPLPQKPGRPQRYDYDYERKGMLNIFAFFEPKGDGDTWGCHRSTHGGGFRLGYAAAGGRAHYPATEKVRVVLDNLNTHTPRPRCTRRSSRRKRGAFCAGWS